MDQTKPEPLPPADGSAGRVCMCCKDLVPPDYPYWVCPRCDMQNAMDVDEDYDVCDCCGGDGVVEYIDHPEVWGEDCPSEMNHLVPCPECNRRKPNAKVRHGSPDSTK